jgi:thiol-disulfide isomerase/thioredoxin
MKNTITVILLLIIGVLLAAISCSSNTANKGNVTVKGQFSNSNGDTIFFVNISSKKFITLDSTVTDADGSFELHGTIKEKGFFKIDIGRNSQQFATVILAPGETITLTGNAKNLGYSWKADGSVDTDHFEELNSYIAGYQSRREKITKQLDSLQRMFQFQVSATNNNKQKLDSLEKIIEPVYNSLQNTLTGMMDDGVKYVHSFIDKHPDSFANIPALRMLSQDEDWDYYEKTTIALEAKYPTAPNVIMMRELIEDIKKKRQPRPSNFQIGQIPTDIILPDPTGKIRKLSELKGKVVLIDFWASWCKPCRVELPNVVAAYNKYHDKGFEVFSVSLDRDQAAWKKAIETDDLIWPWHVLDGQTANQSFATKYGATSIPRAFLLDREGKLVSLDLRGVDLEKALAQQFQGK